MAERFYSPPIQGTWEQARSPLNDRLRAIERMLNDISTGAGIPGSRIAVEAVTAEKIAAGAVTAAKMTITDLIDIANKLTLASGRVIIDKDAFGTDLEGIIINDETYDRVEIGELTSGDYGMKVRDSSGNVTVDMGKLAAESDKKNLVVKVNATNPTYQIDVDADHLKLDDSTQLLANINLTIDITASGANGLDTGSEAANTWYSIWVIHNPTTDTVAGLLSTSTLTPTMPSGYTRKRRVGWVRNDGSSNFLKFHKMGDWWYFATRQEIIDTYSPASSFTDLDCSSAAPPTAGILSHYIFLGDDAETYARVWLRRNGDSGDWIIVGETEATARMVHCTAFCLCDTNQIIEYHCDADCDRIVLWVTGYYDPI